MQYYDKSRFRMKSALFRFTASLACIISPACLVVFCFRDCAVYRRDKSPQFLLNTPRDVSISMRPSQAQHMAGLLAWILNF